MTLPDIIRRISSNGSPPDGLINAIKTVYKITNPLTSGIIKLDASSTYSGNVETVVLWNSDKWMTNSEVGSFVQMKFPKRFVFLSGYSLKKWRVEGFNEGEENDPSKWTLIARNESDQRNFCGNHDGGNCRSADFATYSTNIINKGFQYIRLTGEESSAGGTSCRFSTAAIELYGILSTMSSIMKNGNYHSQRVHQLFSYDFILLIVYVIIVCS